MPLPAGIAYGTVTALIERATGPLAGQVTFRPATPLLRVPPELVVLAPVPVLLDAGGSLSLVLVAGDWSASFALADAVMDPVAFTLPAGGVVDLADAPVVPPVPDLSVFTDTFTDLY